MKNQLDDDLDDPELAVIRRELNRLIAEGDDLEDVRALRLMARTVRRRLVLRTARGDPVTTGQLAELMQLELRIDHREMFEKARALTRRP